MCEEGTGRCHHARFYELIHSNVREPGVYLPIKSLQQDSHSIDAIICQIQRCTEESYPALPTTDACAQNRMWPDATTPNVLKFVKMSRSLLTEVNVVLILLLQ